VARKGDKPTDAPATSPAVERDPGSTASIRDLLAMEESGQIEFSPPRMGGGIFRPADLD
jgi:hypothetical protein